MYFVNTHVHRLIGMLLIAANTTCTSASATTFVYWLFKCLTDLFSEVVLISLGSIANH